MAVSDDVASAPADRPHDRRGIAGDLYVLKVAGAAAAQGHSLEHVLEVAQRANRRGVSMGVAYSGCTLPGADEPLFTVEPGHMAIGMGIHGERGIEVREREPGAAVAALLVDRLIADLTERGLWSEHARVIPIVNGLGSVKHEELYAIYGDVHDLLVARGAHIVSPLVGEFTTSFEMAGFSVSLLVLDDELEQLWGEPAAAPGFHVPLSSESSPGTSATVRRADVPASADLPTNDASAKGVPEAGDVQPSALGAAQALERIRETIATNADHLGDLDSVAGDGDHGIGMQRGTKAGAAAALTAAHQGRTLAETIRATSEAWSGAAGGTSGAIWGAALDAVALELEAQGDGLTNVTTQILAGAALAANRAVMDFGGARPGDKTIVDALAPFAEALENSAAAGEPVGHAWTSAVAAAKDGADVARSLESKRGRSRSHGANSVGAPDPGCASFVLIVEALSSTFTAKDSTQPRSQS